MKNRRRWAGSSRPDTGRGRLLPRCPGESAGQPPAAASHRARARARGGPRRGNRLEARPLQGAGSVTIEGKRWVAFEQKSYGAQWLSP